MFFSKNVGGKSAKITPYPFINSIVHENSWVPPGVLETRGNNQTQANESALDLNIVSLLQIHFIPILIGTSFVIDVLPYKQKSTNLLRPFRLRSKTRECKFSAAVRLVCHSQV